MDKKHDTNFDRFKGATKHELAQFFDRKCGSCKECMAYDSCCDGYAPDCVAKIEEWLDMAADFSEWEGELY